MNMTITNMNQPWLAHYQLNEFADAIQMLELLWKTVGASLMGLFAYALDPVRIKESCILAIKGCI